MTYYQIYSYTYSILFVNKNVSLGFKKLLCTHYFSFVSFVAELSTKLVYKSVFVKDYDFIVIVYTHIYCMYIYIYIYI